MATPVLASPVMAVMLMVERDSPLPLPWGGVSRGCVGRCVLGLLGNGVVEDLDLAADTNPVRNDRYAVVRRRDGGVGSR